MSASTDPGSADAGAAKSAGNSKSAGDTEPCDTWVGMIKHCTTSAVFYKDDYKTVWGDRLSFKRNPDNIFDNNAIEIICKGMQVAHVNRNLAVVLAPLIDDGTIALGGYATGSPEYWWGWLYISVFTSSTKEAMKQRLSQMGVVWAAEEDGQV